MSVTWHTTTSSDGLLSQQVPCAVTMGYPYCHNGWPLLWQHMPPTITGAPKWPLLSLRVVLLWLRYTALSFIVMTGAPKCHDRCPSLSHGAVGADLYSRVLPRTLCEVLYESSQSLRRLVNLSCGSVSRETCACSTVDTSARDTHFLLISCCILWRCNWNCDSFYRL